tara:strand:+ start:39 stop:185 length:147 start_codon:yes stop_codon:yes gene_type:complete
MNIDENWIKLRLELIKLLNFNLENEETIKTNNIILQLKTLIKHYDNNL